jgi:hypothetical protein
LLGFLLPSLHLLAVVGVLDEALTDYIEVKGIAWPKKRKPDLFNRITAVAAAVTSLDAPPLQSIREARNRVAHAVDPVPQQPLTWLELEVAMKVVSEAFVTLGYLTTSPVIAGFLERDPTLFLDELGPSGERVRHKFRVGARVNGEDFLEFSTEILYFPPTSS